jgi:MFS superfamily sulfate permease-like transporter
MSGKRLRICSRRQDRAWSPVAAESANDIDVTGAEGLQNLDADLARLDAALWTARANGQLRELLTTTGLTEWLGTERIYPSVRAAVVAYHAQFGAARQ